MAAFQAVSQPGDTVDKLVWRELRKGPAAVERVLDANPGLADLGAVLPNGTAVMIPDTAGAATAKPLVQLWD
ncbi:Phage Tail Protein X [compost metagenome]